MNGMLKRLGLALAAAALLGAAQQAAAQQQPPAQQQAVVDLPPDLKPFWDAYYAAKSTDDEGEMDHQVRLHRTQADRTLGILLDDYCMRAGDRLPDEMRTLAWSMDRVDRHERYITRVRFVLELDANGRKERYQLMRQLYAAGDALDAVLRAPTEDGYAKVTADYVKVADALEKLGEPESAIQALLNAATVEQRRNHLWERADLLKRVVDIAAKLPWPDADWDAAADEVKRLKAQGYDATKPKDSAPAFNGAPPAGGAPSATPSVTQPKDKLEAFAAGSELKAFKLQPETAKKGLGALALPGFAPPEDPFLWTFSSLEGNGPKPFDTQRSNVLKTGGKQWNLVREGLKFGFDTSGDGTAEIMFTPTNSPELIEVPLADGKTWPLMVCVPGDREQLFGMELNYEPQADRAWLRFSPGGGLRAEVLGESWLLIDSNMSGEYGDVRDEMGDGWTPTTTAEPTFFRDVDAVAIGKARVTVPLSPVMPIQDGFWRVTVKPDGSEITVRQLQLETGQVRLDCATKVPPTHVLIEEVSGVLPGVVLNVVPAKKGGTVTVPAGSWRLVAGRIESGTKTGMQQARIYRGHTVPFEVKAGQTATLAIGAPYTLRFKPASTDIKETEEGETEIAFWSMRIFGRGGEEYAQIYDEPLQPELEVLGPDGKKLGKPRHTAVGDVSAWQALGDKCLFFPVPLRLTLPKLKLSFRLAQPKAHGLLGGPFLPEEAPKAEAGGKP